VGTISSDENIISYANLYFKYMSAFWFLDNVDLLSREKLVGGIPSPSTPTMLKRQPRN